MDTAATIAHNVSSILTEAPQSLLPEQTNKLLAAFTLPQSFAAFFLSFCAFVWLYYEFNFYLVKDKLGLDGPKPLPVIGNMLTVFRTSRGKQTLKWQKKFGDVFVTFMGKSPRINVVDPDVARQIMTKDFDKFQNHTIALSFFDKFSQNFLIALKDKQWKQVRALFTPTFTSSKIRRMFKLIDACSTDLVDCIGEQIDLLHHSTGNKQTRTIKLNVKDVFSLYTLDAIASCCYALKLPRAKGDASIEASSSRNELVAGIMRIFTFDVARTILVFLLPKFISKHLNTSKGQDEMQNLASRLRNIIAKRRKSPVKHDDYLQILVDAKPDDKLQLDANDELENHHAGLTLESLEADQNKIVCDLRKLTAQAVTSPTSAIGSKCQQPDINEDIIVANAVFLLLVGLETTSTLLAHVAYALAYHSEIQQKLYDELKKIAIVDLTTNKLTFDYESLTQCAYLDAVICEDLRFECPIPATDRCADGDYFIEKYKLQIPKGTAVVFGFHAIHHNEKYWPEPEKFKPDRFLPENRDKIVPGSYTPFGQGPRHCLAMRFSLTEAKLALAKTVMSYKFSPAPGKLWPPVPIFSGGMNRYKGLEVLIERRA